MIKFRQKSYAIQLLPLLANSAMIGGTVLGLKQSSDANAAQEEANEKMLREQKKHNRAMEEAARENANAAIEAEKSFAALPTSVLRGGIERLRDAGRTLANTKAGGFAKDLLGTQKENIKKAVGTGASFAALGYGGNRLAASVKDHKENNDEGNKSFLKKAALGTAAVGGSILAAKRGLIPGKFGKTAQTFMTTGKGGSALKSLGKAVNPIVRDETGQISKGGTLGKVGFNAMFLGMPTVSYLAQKKSQNDMIDNTQKEFSIMAGIKAGFRALHNNPGRTITGGINKAASFMGFYGKGGTTAVQNTVGKLAEAGKASGNTWTQKTAEFLGKHKKTANVLAAGGTLAVGGAAMKAGSSLVDKPMKTIDKDAYKMEESENDKI